MVCVLRLEKKKRSEEHTSELQSHLNFVCRLLLEKKKKHFTHSVGAVLCMRTSLSLHAQRLSSRSDLHTLYGARYLLLCSSVWVSDFFFFNDTATTEIYTLSLHDALPI